MKKLITALLAAGGALQSPAISFDFGVGQEIAGGGAVGTYNRQYISTTVASITDLNVSLDISGDFNGDLYALLVHESSGFYSVLLNRMGRTAGNPDGSGSDGLLITLDDQAGQDVHMVDAASGLVTGWFQPDGREADPSLVLDNSARTALLDEFNGIDPNGYWTLFVSDVSALGESRLEGWSLHFNSAAPVPELISGNWLLISFASLALLKSRRGKRN